jgi:hypothetical protein
MQAIKEISGDWRQLLQDSAQPVREYNKTQSKVYKPDAARFKLVVWFKDGKTRYFYSYDNLHTKGAVFTDEYQSLIKLLRLVDRLKDQYKNAIIYTTLEPNKKTDSNYFFEVAKWDIYGNNKTNKAVNFLTNEKNITFDLKRAELYGAAKIK